MRDLKSVFMCALLLTAYMTGRAWAPALVFGAMLAVAVGGEQFERWRRRRAKAAHVCWDCGCGLEPLPRAPKKRARA